MYFSRSVLFLLGCTALPLLAQPVYPLDPQHYGMHKSFGPPQPITPQTVLTAIPENQFTYTLDEDLPSALKRIHQRLDRPFHWTIGQYGKSSYTGALWRQRQANYYLLASLDYTRAKDYKDGDGEKVDFGYQRRGGALVLGILPSLTTEHRFTLLYDDIDDDKQPQHQMDPVNTRRLVSKYTGRFGRQDDNNTLHISLTAMDLKRDANNFALRLPATPQSAKILMEVERQIYTADAHYNFRWNQQQRSSIGLTFKNDVHDAKRFVKTPKGRQQNGYRFPDVQAQKSSFYAAHEWQPLAAHHLKAALNYDWQTANPRQAQQVFMAGKNPETGQPIMLSSAGLWQQYYDQKIQGKIKQNGLSGQLRYTFTPFAQQHYYGEIASLYRLPENPERFAVLPGPNGRAWATNPWIKPERENRLTLGLLINGNGWRDYQQTWQDDYATSWQISGEVFYANVDDFITLDRYRGPKQALKNNIISRNVKAQLAGVDFGYRHNWTAHLSTAVRAQYSYGTNKTDRRPLYQVSPFVAAVGVDWQDYFANGSYSLGSRLHYQHKQSRRDDNPLTGLGMDHDTAAYMTVDFYGAIEWKNKFGIGFGIDNVFDRKYAKYITRDHVEVVHPAVIYAPGRMYWLRFGMAF